MEKHERPADTDFICIIYAIGPACLLDAEHAGIEIDGNFIRRRLRGLDPDPGSGFLIFDLNRFGEGENLPGNALVCESVFPEGFYIVAGASVEDRYFCVIYFYEGVVDAHARQGGHQVLYRCY